MNHHGYTESTEESTEFDASILISPYRSASAVNFLFINSATGWLGTICDFGFREFREGQADCPQIVDPSATAGRLLIQIIKEFRLMPAICPQPP